MTGFPQLRTLAHDDRHNVAVDDVAHKYTNNEAFQRLRSHFNAEVGLAKNRRKQNNCLGGRDCASTSSSY